MVSRPGTTAGEACDARTVKLGGEGPASARRPAITSARVAVGAGVRLVRRRKDAGVYRAVREAGFTGRACMRSGEPSYSELAYALYKFDRRFTVGADLCRSRE